MQRYGKNPFPPTFDAPQIVKMNEFLLYVKRIVSAHNKRRTIVTLLENDYSGATGDSQE